MNISNIKTGQDLISLINLGRSSAFNDFYTSYFEKLVLASDKYLNDVDEAKELVQDVFLKVWEHPEKLKDVLSIKSYLYRAVINSSINSVNRKRNIEVHHVKIASEITEEYVLHIDEENEIIILLRNEIEKLPEQCKRVFKLSRFDNFKHKEIAEQLNISVKTVENHIGVALKHLRARFLNDDFLKNRSKNYLAVLNSIIFL